MWRYDSNFYMKFHHRSHERIICLWGFQKKRCDRVAVLVGILAIKKGWMIRISGYPIWTVWIFGVQKVVGQRSSPGSMPRNEVERVSCFCSWHKEGGASKKETKPQRNQMKYPPKNQDDNGKSTRLKMYFLLNTGIFQCHVGFPRWTTMKQNDWGYEILVDQQNVWTTWLPL